MPRIKYKDVDLQPATLRLVKLCNEIIAEYQAQGFVLTLRQLYYQLVSRDSFPSDRCWRWTGSKWVRDPKGTKNALPNYKWLGTIVNDARLAGLIDWLAIEDRTRSLRRLSHWNSPAEIVEACSKQFHMDMWAEQDYRPEVWIEKDALVGVIEGICNRLDVPYFSCRGYTSQSEMWGAAMRLREYLTIGQMPMILHLGDHDPSGKDMTRDISDRLEMFMGGCKVNRLALNMNQVRRYKPPPNPAKTADSRYRAYIAEFGGESWELDALEPRVIADLISDAVTRLVDANKWKKRARQIIRHQKAIKEVVSLLPR